VGAGAALGLALEGAAGFPLGAGDWVVVSSLAMGAAKGDLAVAGAEAALGVADTGVIGTRALGDIELTPLGEAVGFGSGGLADCPAGSDARRALVWDNVDVLTPMNCSGPALARISFT